MEFVILPDHPVSEEIKELVPRSARSRVIVHPSGRPWLVGCWSKTDIVTAEARDARIALFGPVSATAEALSRRLQRVRSVSDADQVARALHGCFHLVASVGGLVRAQGSISGACQLFYGSVKGVTIAADRPQTLAAMAGTGVDEELLAMQLLAPFGPPWPLSTRSVWRGVRALGPGQHLEIRPNGSERTRTHWTPPEPVVPLAVGAVAVREALENAVAVRIRGTGTISADLSGGKDSTSLCFLTARQDVSLATLHLCSSDRANEDRLWAERSAALLPDAEHVTVPMGDTPGFFAESALAARQELEAPLTMTRRPMLEYIAGFAASRGATRHLQGIGADELFRPSLMSLHALVRSRPLAAVPHVRAVKSMRRWNAVTTVRSLMGHRTYPQWLAASADQITGERVLGTGVGWEVASRVPPWTTPEAVDAIRRLLRRTAAEAPEPLSPLPVHHEMLRLMQANGTIVRASSRVVADHGVSFQAPFLDDQVLTAAMSIRLVDRHRADLVKPILTAAMRGIVPDGILDRQTKGDFGPDLYVGLRHHRGHLLEIFQDSLLARMGLIDAAGPRAALRTMHADAGLLMPLDMTLANELWLRSLPSHVSVPNGSPLTRTSSSHTAQNTKPVLAEGRP
ncbi:asparagine synthase-related protein [Streptomyces sp. S465]|uniref:asparagine synthase-related protein n=1 Tax=Streptomyces sp. S465 TaxID=2979468 RepID=UPI0022A871BB|nr:asparagine synthase-related protein [Streptomyces sp. S465]WAP59539.1 asparagine synthase-related protein [Streptomyces sp. S465]